MEEEEEDVVLAKVWLTWGKQEILAKLKKPLGKSAHK
jgi:hypothetical protein